VCSCSLESQQYPGQHQRDGSREREVIVPPLCSALVRPIWSTASRPGAQLQEGGRAAGVGPEEAHKDALRAAAPLLRRQAEGARLV